MADSEPFPLLNTNDHFSSSQDATASSAKRRRKSSAIQAELLRGDTGAPSLATSFAHLNAASGRVYGPAASKRQSKRRKARGLAQRATNYVVKHTWALPALLLFVFASLYAIHPTESNPVSHFIFLSYKLAPAADAAPDAPAQYGKGLWDIAFVIFYAIVLSFTREFIMQELLRPLARFAGLRSKGKQMRFMEQMYTAVYFGSTGPWGMYIMSHTPVWYFNTTGMYAGFPHMTHEAMFKFYYLFQAAYWLQQLMVMVLGLEAPRKDYNELVGHHLVSLALIGLSYRFHFTYIGLAVYITHDISDFFLATSKSLNYIDSPLQGPYFAFFMGVWIYMRHYLNLGIIYSLFTEFKTVGPFELNWETQQYKCWISQYITIALLSALQALNLFWLFFIIRIAYRFLFFNIIKDDREDGEESDEDVTANGHVANSTAKND
ncbi:longevity assurance proteins LAG1/LAC1 [Cryphonectria parasitica EP155]|uniref:Longevity assurance proteins LAG1/LAC1 n=1 Tax=Cryphonectria parasitica (strain ATCC 38755 / EP155) TaxID=660469 RepID=A0A9P4YC91_CRYP1|nr:longevity assurance proteins LAG1/LAC1 [Cryphonectria parasitica EP155]KAF3770410.1 longevity assurance proteins LAG1/LAC1 [Cryphonectria parasitica EP155]